MTPIFPSLGRLLCPLLLALVLSQEAPAAIVTPEGLSLRSVEEFSSTGIPADQWPALLEAFGRPDQQNAVHALIKSQTPFPGPKLVEFLRHPKLAVRLGALDLLEEAAGDNFNFDPFEEDPTAGKNAEALERWQNWSTGTTPKEVVATLSDDTFHTLALEIMSGSRERSERALQRMEAFGLAAIARIEAFFTTQPELLPAAKAALKTAEYRIVLRQVMPRQSAALARDLSQGSLENQTTALSALSKAGPSVLPVLADFLTSPDALVRETAVDAAFEAGTRHAPPLILARLPAEKTESVLHAMLRGLGEHCQTEAQIAAVIPFAQHPSENVVVTALEALGANSHSKPAEVLTTALKDPRWRVRAAALEAIGKRKLLPLTPLVKNALNDKDLFVRVTAVETLPHVAEKEAVDILATEFTRQNELKAPILRTLFKTGKQPAKELWEELRNAPPEVILQGLETLEDRDDHSGKRIPYATPFATHPNHDVSASALRLLASRGRELGLLLPALKSSDSLKVDAILDALNLPHRFLSPETPPPNNSPSSDGPLDRLYRLFNNAGPKTPAPAIPPLGQSFEPEASLPDQNPASPAEFRATLEKFFLNGSPRQRFRAAVVLAAQNDARALEFLVAGYDTYNDLDRRMLTLPIQRNDWADGPASQLALRLLRDPANEVREDAISLWLKPNHLSGLLDELVRPGSALQPDDIYGWELDRSLASSKTTISNWATPLLKDPKALTSHKVFAIVLLARTGQKALIPPFLDSPDPWLRRAAYRAIGKDALSSHLDALLRDDSAFVRAALPFIVSPHNQGWLHWFDDSHHVADSEDHERMSRDSSSEFGAWAQKAAKSPELNPLVLAGLEKLTQDPSETVRFEALFALMRLNRPIDPATLASLLASQNDSSQARSRVGNFVENNFARLSPGYRVLVPLLDHVYEEGLAKILAHFQLDKETTFASFSSLAELAPLPASAPAAIAPIETPTRSAQPFRVIFFHKAGCRDCQRVREMLERHAPDFPQILIEEHAIDQADSVLFNETLSERFSLKENLRQAAPSIYTQEGVLIREQITFAKLGDLLRKTSTAIPDPNWAKVEARQTQAAQETVRERYQALSLGVIASAGLLDGINPCAFATIIFLLSYLQIARRSPREILAVGAAFIAAVFLTYFAVGLGLAQLLSKLAGYRTASALLSQLLAAFALVIAFLSFRDATLAARGQLAAMTLQLPGALKSQIRSVIREGSRATRFVLAAFAAGILISLLELACTGQVYLPTIVYMVQSGEKGALSSLLLYNLAFISPLVVVFGLAWGGLQAPALIRFQTERTALLKTLTGFLFLLLAAFLLFGHRLSNP